MLSPQAPPPAYIAVFFQGLMGEILFLQNRKMFKLSCIILAILALLESGLQRILVLTIVYGNDLWKVINDFINGLTRQKVATNYSLLIGSGYVLLHLITGVLIGWWASVLPGRIESWNKEDKYKIEINEEPSTIIPSANKKRKRLKKGLFIIWIILIALYAQSYFNIGQPLLPTHIAVKIFIRSLIIVLSWIFIIGPLLKQILHRWLQKEKTNSQLEIKEVLQILPSTQQLVIQSWKKSAHLKGRNRLSFFSKMILVNALRNEENNYLTALLPSRQKIHILSAPIQSGKTTSLINWSANRNDVYGILTPVVNGKRMFMNAYTKEQFPMEAEEGEQETLKVGKFTFSKKNFDKAIQIIRRGIFKNGWLVIDEIGPLELNSNGFYEIVSEVLANRTKRIILIVREGLVQHVINHFNIDNAEIIKDISTIKKAAR